MVFTASITEIVPDKLYLNVLPQATQKAFLQATTFNFLPCAEWYLAGGTAFALQVGHRQSIDLDFFTSRGAFKEVDLERDLMNTGSWKTTFQDRGTLYGELVEAKMSFIAYPFFQPSSARVQCGAICMLVPDDIAAMKIIAISQRGKKRDFVDLYWYCLHVGMLVNVVERATKQYPGQEHNLPHILKSLVYFTDAEDDPMPTLLFDANWKTIKAYFQKEIPKIAKELLQLE